jgi:hypothetical protein
MLQVCFCTNMSNNDFSLCTKLKQHPHDDFFYSLQLLTQTSSLFTVALGFTKKLQDRYTI